MTREKAAQILNISYDNIARVSLDRCRAEFAESPGYVWDAIRLAIAALREQEERSKKCPYCDVAKANEGVKNTVLWVKEPETNKWTMMGKKLLFCPMCGRRLEEV